MPLKSRPEKEEFRFTWRIENFSMCQQETKVALQSPSFTRGILEKTDWHLKLYRRGNADSHITCALVRENDKGPDSIIINHQFSLVIATGMPNFEFKSESKALSRGTSTEQRLIAREKLFMMKHVFLPRDTLTIQCDLWESETSSSVVKTTPAVKSLVECLYDEPAAAQNWTFPEQIYAATGNEVIQIKRKLYPYLNECSARTRIGVERREVIWSVKKFSSLTTGQKLTLPITCPSERVPPFTLTMTTKADDKIQIDICKISSSILGTFLVVCQIAVLDVDGREYLRAEAERAFASPKSEEVWSLTSFFTKSKLVENKNLCLPNNELTLRFDFTISIGVDLSQMEEYNFVLLACETATDGDSVGTLVEDLRSFYAEGRAFDFNLKIKDKIFPAHKAVLCFRSPVFCAMLDHDTAEKQTSSVNITDMDARTLSRMLEFMYTDSVELIRSDNAIKLYTAAEKYQIRTLRKKCSAFLQAHLSDKNVFEVLVLAEMHQDQELLSSVRDFLFEPPYHNLLSPEFENLIDGNTKLAHHILCFWVNKLKSEIAIAF